MPKPMPEPTAMPHTTAHRSTPLPRLGRAWALGIGLGASLAWAQPPAPAPGRYTLWQDGEGGPTCQLRLTPQRTIGGQAIEGAQRCAASLQLAGDPYAWFMDAQGRLVIVDATRQPLLRMERLPDGDYKDRRQGDYVNAVLLSPAGR